MSEKRSFPKGFLWGASTSAHQIEGSPLADGAGPSNWHRFSHTPGRTANGETGDTACDHYRRYLFDVAMMKELGLTSYRFSISWSRVVPEGTGNVNEKGLDFYRRLADSLLEAGIQPMVTLYHWDLPAALDDRGGWLNRDSSWWFADFANIVYKALDDRVAMWATINEPRTVADAGYLQGIHAPGHRSPFEAPIAAHNLLRAHSAAVQAYRANGTKPIGIVVNLEPRYAASETEEDAAAVRRADAWANLLVLDPLLLGAYPAELTEMFGEAWPAIPAWDIVELMQPIDFIGVNYFTRCLTKHDPSVAIERASRVHNPRAACTEMGWEVFPQGLTDVLVRITQRYGRKALYVTENGAAFYDPPVPDRGSIDDPHRVSYTRAHLNAVLDAIERGADVRGYYARSLMDGYEWNAGYAKRFGLFHVDFATQQRTPKASARFYSAVIRENGL